MSDWRNALEEARLLLQAAGATPVASPAVWARLDGALTGLEGAVRRRDPDRLRLALYTLEDSLPAVRMRMPGGPDDLTAPPPPLAERLDRLITRIRVAEADVARPGRVDPGDH
ncbi:CATRA system-associated protein, partial [Streptomyces sp. UH6]|uniref:CATRA system-associated protein n=1 Tax=Streptomyces sp. UH6 TaxID=2748379 RepID=UPI0015D4ED5E